MPEMRSAWSKDTPFACRKGIHFWSNHASSMDCSACKSLTVQEVHVCFTGRHEWNNPLTAQNCELCRPYTVNVALHSLQEAKHSKEIPDLQAKLEAAKAKVGKIQAFIDDFSAKIAAARSSRTAALRRGENPEPDILLVTGADDVRVLEGDLAEAKKEAFDLEGRLVAAQRDLNFAVRQLALAARLDRRDQIYRRMQEAIILWNAAMREILELRQEAGPEAIVGDGVNGGTFFPLWPPGLKVGMNAQGHPPFMPFNLIPMKNISDSDILAWEPPK